LYFFNVYALAATGALVWSYATGGGVTSSPAIGFGGGLYGGSSDNRLYFFEPPSMMINFKPASSDIPAGFLKDNGGGYTGRGYGWW